MNIFYFILTMAVFQPLTAHAEAVFNDAESFQIAKAVKLGRETTSAQIGLNLPGNGVTGRSTTNSGDGNIKGAKESQQCPGGKYMNASGGCSPCPENGHCTGTSDWMCQSGYWQNAASASCVSCSGQTYIAPNSWDSKKCDGTTSYTCLSTAWKDSRNSHPGQCSQCPTDATCNNGVTYTCNPTNGSWGPSPNTYRVESNPNPTQCPRCPSNWECNGSATKYCLGKNAGQWKKTNAYVSNGTTNNPSACTLCPSNWECNGSTTKYCYGRKTAGSTWSSSYAYVKTGTNDLPTTCESCGGNNYECNGTTARNCKGTANGSYSSSHAYKVSGSGSTLNCSACPTDGVCNGTDFRCTPRTNDSTWSKTNGYKATASTCGKCKSNEAYECNGLDRKCYGLNTAGKNGESEWDSKFALATNAQSTTCISCPEHAFCKGTTDWRCDWSYYRTGTSYSAGTPACKTVYSGTVCESGYTKEQGYSENKGNTRYCVQEVPSNPLSDSYSNVGENCPSGYVWRYRRTGDKGGSLSGIWAPGCYPQGNCNSGEACMPMGFTNGAADFQCTSQTMGTGRSCNPNA